MFWECRVLVVNSSGMRMVMHAIFSISVRLRTKSSEVENGSQSSFSPANIIINCLTSLSPLMYREENLTATISYLYTMGDI